VSNGVAVVIPNRNYGRFLGQALQSCVEQTVKPTRIVVADAGSTDESREVFESLCYLHKLWVNVPPIPGIGRWRNAGIAAVDCEWIISLDADDWLEPTYIERCLEAAEPTKGIVATGLRWESSDPNEVRWEQNPDEPITIERLLRKNRLFAASMFRRRAWEEVGGFWNLPINEDWDLWIRILAQGWDVAVIPEPLLHHRSHDDAVSVVAAGEAQARMRAALRERHRELLALYG